MVFIVLYIEHINNTTGVKKMKVQADNINGVYVVDIFEGEVLTQPEFYESLSDNPDDRIICAEIDEDMADKISAEYGRTI